MRITAHIPKSPPATPVTPGSGGESRPALDVAPPTDTLSIAPTPSFKFAPTDLDANGNLHVILYSESPDELNTVRQVLEQSIRDGGVDRDLPIINGFSAHLKPADVPRLLAHMPEGVGIRVNRLLYPSSAGDLLKDTSTAVAPGPPPPPVDGVDPSRVVIGANKVWAQGYTGKGIGVAVVDSGIHPHPDLQDKIVGWVDIADGKAKPYDKFGHGTHVAGDIAGTGARSAGRFRGIAPDANLIGVRITTVAEAIKALQWCIDNKEQYNIRVVNMSLGDFATRSYKDDPWAQAAEKAVQAGITVIVAAGNEGPDAGTVSTPGTDPKVITVGAVDDKHTVERVDDTMAPFSSRGPTSTDGLSKPDVTAPGVAIFSTLSPGATLDVPELPHVGKDYIAISGTSMATPLVSGLVADLLQANPSLTPEDVKTVLQASADRYLPDGTNSQGYGMVNGPRALELALAMKNGAPAPTLPPLPQDTTVAKAPAPKGGPSNGVKPMATPDGYLLA
ncbi:MAG: peptidase S8 [Proteobacteria bacterium]|nr:peptidase S8 [Pseudomonadota bacterium]